jgi:hypothetical protein
MSAYKIKKYSYDQAKKLGVEIKPSTNKSKKIDVFKNSKKVASIGAVDYLDYPSYKQIDPSLAEERRKAYLSRHKKDSQVKNSPGFYAAKLLW